MFKRMITTSDCLSPESTKSLQIGKKVSLSPLKAQVGGHVYMKLLNDNHVCKPLNDREVKFYQNTPKNLLQHVPKFLGTVQIQQQQQHNGESSSRYKIVDYLTFNRAKYGAIFAFSPKSQSRGGSSTCLHQIFLNRLIDWTKLPNLEANLRSIFEV